MTCDSFIDTRSSDCRALDALAIELYARGESPEAIYAAVKAEAERIVLAEVRAKLAAISNPVLKAAMTKLLEKEIANADQP